MTTDTLPDALDEYLTISVNRSSPIRRELLSRVEHEQRQREIRLTNDLSNQPSRLTPQMFLGYQDFISPRRQHALHELKTHFESEATAEGVKGFLLEAKIDKIGQQK